MVTPGLRRRVDRKCRPGAVKGLLKWSLRGLVRAQKHCSRPQVQLRPGPYWAAAWYNIVTTAGGCLTAECGVLRVGGEQFPLLSAGRRLPAASSVVVTGALGYNTCLFFKNVAIPFKSGPWTGSKDSSRTSPCGSS